jgi:glycosyltransferase involved in cell wall biosynthesis
MPLVSIIVPTHDRAQMLKEAVDSALAQTFQDFELIVVLNGASAASVEMANRLGANPKVKVVEMADDTLAASRNFGLEFASGEWIAFLDDDDIWLPDKLATQLDAAVREGADLVTCNFTTFNSDGELPSAGLTPLPSGLGFAEALMLANYVSGGSAVLVRAAAIRKLGGFDAKLRGCEDWDMWRRLSWDHTFCRLDRALVRYRRHGTNMTTNLDLVLQAEAQHFAKLLIDTPLKLRHMLPRAKRRFARLLLHNLTEQGVLDGHATHLYHVGFACYRMLGKLTGGLSGKLYRRLRDLLGARARPKTARRLHIGNSDPRGERPRS